MENITVKTFINYFNGFYEWTGWKACEVSELPTTYAELCEDFTARFLIEVTLKFKGETFEKIEIIDDDSTEQEFNRFVALLKKFA